MPSKPTPAVLTDFIGDGAEPSVDFLNSNVPIEAPKSNIGVRKIQPKKGGIGAKKGLGATRVKANFADIEQRATLANQLKEPVVEKQMTVEEENEAMTSVRLAYQDLSIKKQKEEDRLKTVDPNKAKQMERLGMGFGNRGGVSHSMMTDMQTIDQDLAPVNMKAPTKSDNNSKSDFFDDYSTSMYNNSSNSSSKQDFRDAMMMGFEPIDSNNQSVHSMFSPVEKKEPSNKNAVADRQPSSSSYGRNNRDRESKSAASTPSNNYDTDTIQKKFAGAKGISSDQFFGNEQSSFEKSANLSKFQGSSSISSADYFGGDGPQQSGAGRSKFSNSKNCLSFSFFS